MCIVKGLTKMGDFNPILNKKKKKKKTTKQKPTYKTKQANKQTLMGLVDKELASAA